MVNFDFCFKPADLGTLQAGDPETSWINCDNQDNDPASPLNGEPHERGIAFPTNKYVIGEVSMRKGWRESPIDVEIAAAPTHPAIEIELRDTVIALLSSMNLQEQQIAVFLFVDGMSQGEIADELGVTRVTVNKRVQALRARTRSQLERA